MEIILQLTVIIVCSKLAGDLAVRLGQPSVLGKLIVGVLIGPAVLGWVENSEILEAFSMMSFLATSDVSLIGVIGKKAIFFVAIGLLGWKVVPFLMRKLSGLKVTEPVISIGILTCFSIAYFAESLGVAGIIGAFAAGIAISRTEHKREVEKKVEPIAYAVFVPVFLTSI
jgi:Kef-type K+ transport system membrane component KefB